MAKKTKNIAPEKNSGKKFRIFCILAALMLIWWINNYTIKQVNTSVTSDKISSPVRITVLSDLHRSGHSISSQRIVDAVSDSAPDAVMILGDMFSSDSSDTSIKEASDLICSIAGLGKPVYFVPGEHDALDGSSVISQFLLPMRNAGVHIMDYKSEYLETDGGRIYIMGIDNAFYSNTFDLRNAFTRDTSCFNIVLAHIPNYEKFALFGADLTLCADTHGGMIQLPFLGPAYDNESGNWFPKLSGVSYYDKGWFGYESGAMYITSGLGDYPLPARFCNRPEIVTIELRPADKE